MLTIAGQFHVHHLPTFRVRLSVNWPLVVTVAAALIGSTLLLLGVNFVTPKTLAFNYAQNNSCIVNPTLFPGATKVASDNYHVNRIGNISFGNFPLYSHSTCFQAKKLTNQQASSAKINLSALPWPSQNITIKSAPAPMLNLTQAADKPISLTDQLKINLSSTDKTHNYLLQANNKSVSCNLEQMSLSCPLEELGLNQATSYPIEIVRELGGSESQPILKSTITTVTAVTITSSSISPGALVLDKPDKLTITTDKPLTQASKISLSSTKAGAQSDIKFNYTIEGAMITITPLTALPRESVITLNIGEITASDSGYLEKPYSLSFTTSGGPKVTSTGLGTYGQSTASSATLKFDSKLLANQNFGQVVSLTKAGSPVATSVTPASPTSLTLKPNAPLERCTTYTITVNGSIANEFGVPAESPYSFNFRTLCQEVFSIGTSNAGRSITAYKFGNGPTKILYIGATHGDELSSKYILDSWINDLEANYAKIPSSKTIIVIPVINPDGALAGTRVNGRNVDLNRNFPIANWKSDVIMPDKKLLVGGGGSAPLSEPESKALADYTASLAPRLVLTYHSKGGMVVANEAGDSVAIAQNYGKSTRFWATAESKLGTAFAYDTTGAYENWLAEKLSIPGLLIELKSHTTNEFSAHKSAMWATVNL